MPWGAAAVAGAMVVGSVISADAAGSAADTQAGAARDSANIQSAAAARAQDQLLAAGREAAKQFTPYADQGTTALANLSANNEYFNKQFSNEDLNSYLAPNYDFGLKTGQQTNLMASNAAGGAIGGNALMALNNYSQNYAQNAYTAAFNQYQAQRGNISAQNMAQANLGLAGATGSANAQLGTATNVANLGIGSANAQAAGMNAAGAATAAGQIGAGNAYAGATNSLGSIGYSYFQNQQNLQNQQYQQGLNNMGGYNSSQIAMGASPGGSFTPTAGNSFIIA